MSVSYYSGEYQDGKKHNNGCSIDATVEMHDNDITVFKDVVQYTGEFIQNLPHGTGTMKHLNLHKTYTGEFKNGKKYGFGKTTQMFYGNDGLLLREKDEHEGEYKDDLPNGIGVSKWTFYTNNGLEDGQIIRHGRFKKGHLTGFGASKTQDGEIYEGTWYGGLKHGNIIRTSPGKTHKYIEEYNYERLVDSRELTALEKAQDQYKSRFDI